MARGVYVRTRYTDGAIKALHAAINSYNGVYGDYRKEQAFILMSNALELLGKAILLKNGENIYTDKHKQNSIPAERVFSKLLFLKKVEQIEVRALQQVISLRNAASHSLLPFVADDIAQHLMFMSVKSFENLLKKHFKFKDASLGGNFLSVATGLQFTYADRVEGLMKNFKKRTVDEKTLVWLLGRGAAFKGTRYISQADFERQVTSGKRRSLLDRTELGFYVKESEQIQVVLVQAPKGYTAEVEIKKSRRRTKQALPVMIRRTDPNKDYPFFTADLADMLGKDLSFVATSARNLGLKDNLQYSTRVEVNRSGSGIPKYNQVALDFLKDYLRKTPNYNPYKK